MSIKNFFILSLIGVFGIGLFVLFFNLLSQELPQNKTTTSKSAQNNTTNSTSTVSEITPSKVAATPTAQTNTSNKTTTSNTNETATQVQTPKPVTETPLKTTTTSIPSSNSTATPTATKTVDPVTIPDPVVSTPSTKYKDGTYKSSASYRVPGDRESIDVSVTIKNDIVTAVQDNHSGSNGESASYQDSFESSVSQSVVGKKIDSVSLSRVGGASLTTRGFMSAFAQIQSQAQN
jgi:cytoskeletal protein RodZ